MMRTLAAAILLVTAWAVAGTRAQSPLDQAAMSLRAHQAMVALDRYLETWNSRNPAVWATSLHFPHVRRVPGRSK